MSSLQDDHGDAGSLKDTNMERFQSALQTDDPDSRQRTEVHPSKGSLTVDKQYFSLNPWYDQHPEKPTFGLAKPLPRTIRPGMWWGKKDLRDAMYKIESKDEGPQQPERQENEKKGKQDRRARKTQGGLGSDSRPSTARSKHPSNRSIREDQDESDEIEVPLYKQQDAVSDTSVAPSHFTTEVDGRQVRARRLGDEEAAQVLRDRGVERDQDPGSDEQKQDRTQRQDHRDKGQEHGEQNLELSHSRQANRNTFGLQDGLPVLTGEGKEDEETDVSEDEFEEKQKQEQQEAARQTEEERREFYNTFRNPLARLRARHPQLLAEWLATFVFIFLGLCGNLQVATSQNQAGDYQSQAWAWGLSVMLGIYLAGGISGAHLNPLISVTLSIFRGFPWRMCIGYVLVQMFAGFCAGGLAWLIYRDAILHMDPLLTPSITGKAFYTLPQPWVTVSTAFFSEFVAAAILMATVLSLGDDSNSPPGDGMSALILGLVIYLLELTISYQTGLAMSPCRDFGPRLVALFAGYGTQTFTTGWWAYGPIGAGFAGSITGAMLYDSFVFVGGESPLNYNWPKPEEIPLLAKLKTKRGALRTKKGVKRRGRKIREKVHHLPV